MHNTKKSQLLDAEEVGKNLELNFRVKIHNEKMNGNPQNSVALARFIEWPSTKTLKITTKKRRKFFKESAWYLCLPKTHRAYVDPASRREEFKHFCSTISIKLT